MNDIHTKENLFSLDPKTTNENHISMSNSLIMEAYRLIDQKMVLVLGCGQCKEIPIESLIISSYVDLIDLDREALQKLRVNLTSNCCLNLERVSFVWEDITGFIVSLSKEVENCFQTAGGAEKSLRMVTNLLDSAKMSFWTSPVGYQYTLIICSLLLTQLQAFVLSKLERIFIKFFPKDRGMLCTDTDWIKAKFRLARKLEEAFVAHLKTLMDTEAIIYISDTVRVCFAKHISDGLFSTEGSWIALKSSRLVDYFDSSYKVIKETSWPWFLPKTEKNSDGRLYDVQALILKPMR